MVNQNGEIKVEQTQYRGRFAPTPTGPLHMGSLVAALASFLDAKSNNGKWLLRIDDLDPPREAKGAKDSILKSLETFGLFWDEEVVFQSNQNEHYQYYLNQLAKQVYRCKCSRKEIGSNSYQGVCWGKTIDQNIPCATRFHILKKQVSFKDAIQGGQNVQQAEDFVIKRKDGLWAYHMAVVVDDYLSGITDVVRGVDLLESSFRHIQLQNALGFSVPKYAHIPVLIEENGQKLSKQNLAKPIAIENQNAKDQQKVIEQLQFALKVLAIDVDNADSVQQILKEAVEKWSVLKLVGKKEIKVSSIKM